VLLTIPPVPQITNTTPFLINTFGMSNANGGEVDVRLEIGAEIPQLPAGMWKISAHSAQSCGMHTFSPLLAAPGSVFEAVIRSEYSPPANVYTSTVTLTEVGGTASAQIFVNFRNPFEQLFANAETAYIAPGINCEEWLWNSPFVWKYQSNDTVAWVSGGPPNAPNTCNLKISGQNNVVIATHD
jgi:hypothetical protein